MKKNMKSNLKWKCMRWSGILRIILIRRRTIRVVSRTYRKSQMSWKLKCLSLIHWNSALVNNILPIWLKSRLASEIKAQETWNSDNMSIVNKVLKIQLIKIFINRKFLNLEELVTGKVNTICTLWKAAPLKKEINRKN